MQDYSSKQISRQLNDEISAALKNIRGWGSVEIFVQDYKVTQIVERNIKKTQSPSKNNNSKTVRA